MSPQRRRRGHDSLHPALQQRGEAQLLCFQAHSGHRRAILATRAWQCQLSRNLRGRRKDLVRGPGELLSGGFSHSHADQPPFRLRPPQTGYFRGGPSWRRGRAAGGNLQVGGRGGFTSHQRVGRTEGRLRERHLRQRKRGGRGPASSAAAAASRLAPLPSPLGSSPGRAYRRGAEGMLHQET